MFDRLHRHWRARTTAGVVLAVVVLGGCAESNEDQNSLKPKGPYAQQILDLFSPFFWIAVVIGIGVTAATIFVALRFREKPGEERNPKQTHGNTVLEVGWTIVPALILAVMAVPTVATIFDLAEEPDDAYRIDVVAKQWWWEYHYPSEGIVTANELHIPADRDIALYISAPKDGVIHSFWIPNLNGKKDAVPGREEFLKIKADEPTPEGQPLLGQCAEYCGLSHANMRLRVYVHDDAGFEKWIAEQKAPANPGTSEFVTEKLSQWQCVNCHSFDDVEATTLGPNLTRLGDRDTFASGIYETNLENLTKWVYNAPHEKPAGPLAETDPLRWMPNFEAQGMTEAEAAEIAEFLLCDTATDPGPECAGGNE